MDSRTIKQFTPAANEIKPLLNRLVFHGIHTCRGEPAGPGPRMRLTAGDAITLHALATTALERVTPDLAARGFVRTKRTARGEEWTYHDQVRISIATAAGDDPESPDAIVREYAVLLTRTVALGDDCLVRVSAPVPQLALYWLAHEASRLSMVESGWVEDVIELVVMRDGILDEVAAAPIELRLIIARAAAEFLASDSCGWVLRRALPDARQAPDVADLVQRRFAVLASLAATG